MFPGVLAIYVGGLAILLATFFYTRAMFAGLRADAAEAGTEGVKGRANTAGRDAGRAEAKAERLSRLGRRAYFVSMAGAVAAAIALMSLILGRHYEVSYVWRVTDQSLPLNYRIAAFWAEQEGTFLLWALYGFFLSLFLIRGLRRNERFVMPFICGVQLFLFVMLMVMNPFRPVPQHPEGTQVATGHMIQEWLGLSALHNIPTDGQGLNILLQNFWMTIHPPIMFLGFTATLFPCALALGALMRRNWDVWVKPAMPWVLFAFLFLGFGKFLGGYWAYETLGWGGYWAWDPVENASFVPWLLSAALVHGLQVQQARGSWKQVNLLLAITSFLSFFYGTFLTRSGALDQFSVHSFVSPGDVLRLLLLGFLLFFCALFWGIWLLRVRQIRSEVTYERMDERPFGLFLGIVLFIGSAAIVLIGMSWPILSRTFGEKAASIDYQFYNRALLPVGFFIALLMAITPMLSWRRREGARWKPTPLLLFGLATGAALLIGTPLALYAAWRGRNDPAIWLFSAAVGLALITNSVMLFRTARFGLIQTGGWIMHVGFCLCLIGVVSTSRYSIDMNLTLEKGQTKPLFGFNFTYEGVQKQPNGRDTLAVRVKRGEYEAVAAPRSFTHKEQNFNTPYILKFWDRDIYIAPGQRFDESREGQLQQGQIGALDGDQTIRFERFTGGGGAREDGAIDIGVSLTYSDGHRTVPVQPRFILFPTGEVVNAPVELPGGKYAVQVKRVIPPDQAGGQPTVLLRMTPINPPDIVRFDISSKPWVNVLWLGGYTMFLGGLLAWRKRARVAAHAREHAGEPQSAAGEPRKEPIRPKRRSGLRPEPAAMGSGED